MYNIKFLKVIHLFFSIIVAFCVILNASYCIVLSVIKY
jgi:hypothetical protein